ncbi:glycosyltransferase family 2 protein [Marinimicrobium sp. ABcell2]|uniref:glycosyltransferase family 2 protein n=1 Tax=Marinimicrobium sp. ABcell2 TaxID=3069751 RepID=UPI0027B767B3|nr:glycosyltransferase family 2 protein [Marinimicrobium sp. ABcell2]MDQ2076184.1 glycosyltransferase family 2 protein [Marinimicrobium sp. ABcell2]
MLKTLFWLFAVGSVYSYFLYPIILKCLSLLRARAPKPGQDPQPLSLSVIVTAYNEAERIREKIENTLELSFDPERLELIIASDCSDDGTDDIVREYADKGVKLVRAAERLGKENAQKTAIEQASGDVIVFSDVATRIPQDALVELERYFQDPTVGAVSSEDRFISQSGEIAGEGAYVKYEMWLRRQESQLAGLVGLSGSFFAARKTVCEQWDIHSPSDFNTALNAARLGLRAVTAPKVLGYYRDLKDPRKEYLRKVRTVLRGMAGLARHKEVLNPARFGLFAFQVFSHKLMRWLVPWFLVGLFFTTLPLINTHPIFMAALVAQVLFYGLALLGQLLPGTRTQALVKIVYFFVQVNLAILDSSIKFLRGNRMTTWKPSAR